MTSQNKTILKVIVNDILCECKVPSSVMGIPTFGWILNKIEELDEGTANNCITLIRKDLDLFTALINQKVTKTG